MKHVVILTQENRSFDNYFGMLKGVRGFGDRFGIPLAGGRKVWRQYGKNNQLYYPYHLDSRLGNAQRVSGAYILGKTGRRHGTAGAWATGLNIKIRSQWAITKKPKLNFSMLWPMPLPYAMPITAPCTPAQSEPQIYLDGNQRPDRFR